MKIVLTEIETGRNTAKVSGASIGTMQLPKIHFWFTDAFFNQATEEKKEEFFKLLQDNSNLTGFFIDNNSLCVTLSSEHVKIHGFHNCQLDFGILSRRLKRQLETYVQISGQN